MSIKVCCCAASGVLSTPVSMNRTRGSPLLPVARVRPVLRGARPMPYACKSRPARPCSGSRAHQNGYPRTYTCILSSKGAATTDSVKGWGMGVNVAGNAVRRYGGGRQGGRAHSRTGRRGVFRFKSIPARFKAYIRCRERGRACGRFVAAIR